jgi:hypothetical protein
VLLNLYPFSGAFDFISPIAYLLCSFVAAFLLWGATTIVALRNPIEAFLGKVLEDGKKENQADVELLETRTSILEMLSETLQDNSKLLGGLKDIALNVRREVLRIEPLNESVESLKNDMETMKQMIGLLESKVSRYKLCPACGRDILPQFRLCPYCGENLLKPATTDDRVLLPPLAASHAPQKRTQQARALKPDELS